MYTTIAIDYPCSWIITHARCANVMRRVGVAEIAQLLRCIVQVADVGLLPFAPRQCPYEKSQSGRA
jgi:hypothetical protein